MKAASVFIANRRSCSRQAGVILIIALVFMAVLALIVLAGMRTGILQERMASNVRYRQLALQSAEAVMRDAEVSVVKTAAAPFDPFTATTFAPNCAGGFCGRPVSGNTPRWKTLDWTATSATRTFASTNSNITSTLVPSQPRYIVELINTPVNGRASGGGICPTVVSRVTAQGIGPDYAEVYVQSMYRTQPDFCNF